MLFKNVDKVEAKMCSLGSILKYYESTGIKILLEKNEWELIFVDELKVDTGKHVHRSWARREKRDYSKQIKMKLY